MLVNMSLKQREHYVGYHYSKNLYSFPENPPGEMTVETEKTSTEFTENSYKRRKQLAHYMRDVKLAEETKKLSMN